MEKKSIVRGSILAAMGGEYGYAPTAELGKVLSDGFTVVLCPICHCKTLDGYNICSCCGWEYDGLPETHASSVNGGVTQSEYRAEYQKIIKEGREQDNV